MKKEKRSHHKNAFEQRGVFVLTTTLARSTVRGRLWVGGMSRQRFVLEDRETETVPVAALRAHPRNYREHPDDQIEHLAASLKEHGFYRNVVIARDGTILAGHGVIEAAKRLGLETARVVRLPIEADSPAALKVLTGDNEIEHLAEQDDRLLSELLREIAQDDPLALLGTGYDEAMLANLVYVTRPASEIQDHDEAAHWVGMPDYEPGEGEFPDASRIVVHFRNGADRAAFARRLEIEISPQSDTTWYPPMERNDLASVRFEESA